MALHIYIHACITYIHTYIPHRVSSRELGRLGPHDGGGVAADDGEKTRKKSRRMADRLVYMFPTDPHLSPELGGPVM